MLDLSTAKARLDVLKKNIKEADSEYYGTGNAILEDQSYDLLLKEVQEIERAFPSLRTENSPTQQVAYSTTSKLFQQVAHDVPMLSLANIYTQNELTDWYQSNQKLINEAQYSLFCELKIDGLAVSLIYEDGVLKQALTRGDGEVGDDVTQNVMQISNIPKEIALKEKIILRGEIYFPKSEFDSFNQHLKERGLESYKNPRNTAAGSIRMKDAAEVKKRNLQIIIYDIVFGSFYNDHQKNIEKLKEQGFTTSNVFTNSSDLQAIFQFCQEQENNRTSFEFDIDGVVMKINDLTLREKLGARSKSPRWAMAWKFKTEEAKSKLIKIENSVGRTGIITPVAILEPTNLMGTTIKRASLYNYDQIKRLDLYQHDTVIITKGGEIIPKVIAIDFKQRDEKAQPVEIPSFCPVCQSILVQYENEVDLRCANEHCTAKRLGALQHFVSKKGADIQSLGDSQINVFIERGYLQNIADIYHLDRHFPEIKDIEGFGDKSVEKLSQAIERSKNLLMNKFIYSLGIRHIGEKAAKTLAQELGSIDDLLALTLDQLEMLDDFGPIMNNALTDWLNQKENRIILKRLIDVGVRPEKVKKIDKSKIRTIVITGTLSKPRDDLKTILEEHDFKVQSSLSKKTQYLLVGEQAGSKLKKAEELGVKIISEADLENYLLQS